MGGGGGRDVVSSGGEGREVFTRIGEGIFEQRK